MSEIGTIIQEWSPGEPLHPAPSFGYLVEPPATARLGLGLGLGKRAYVAQHHTSWAMLLQTIANIFTAPDRNVTFRKVFPQRDKPGQPHRLAELLI